MFFMISQRVQLRAQSTGTDQWYAKGFDQDLSELVRKSESSFLPDADMCARMHVPIDRTQKSLLVYIQRFHASCLCGGREGALVCIHRVTCLGCKGRSPWLPS